MAGAFSNVFVSCRSHDRLAQPSRPRPTGACNPRFVLGGSFELISPRVQQLWMAGRIGKAAELHQLEQLAAILGVSSSSIVQLYGRPEQVSEPTSVVYLIGPRRPLADGTPVKIGYTRQPIWKRLMAFQAGAVDHLRLVAYLLGGVDLEREFHQRFAKHCIREDWFRMCDAIRETFDPLSPQRLPGGERT